MASPAIIGGLFLVFMEVLNDYGAANWVSTLQRYISYMDCTEDYKRVPAIS